MSTLNAHNLLRIINQVRDHQDHTHRPIAGIRFDAEADTLYAVATDRYTVAVARAGAWNTSTPWAATLPRDEAKTLRRWLQAIDHDDLVTIEPHEDGKHLVVRDARTTLTFETADGDFVKWRGLFAGVLAKDTASPVTGYMTNLLARWQEGDQHVRAWSTGPDKPMVIAGKDFLGMQMPTSVRNDFTVDAVTAEWKTTFAAAEAAEATAELAAPGGEPKKTRDFTEWLLRVVATSTTDIMDADSVRTPAFHRSIDASCAAMAAYRLMVALKTADPRFAEKVLAELDGELEGGEYAEFAWEYAQDAGHNPEEWVKQHQEWRTKLLAEAAAAKNDE